MPYFSTVKRGLVMRLRLSIVAMIWTPMLLLGTPLQKTNRIEKVNTVETQTIILAGNAVPLTMRMLLSPQQIQTRVAELGVTLSEKFAHKQPVVIGVLAGASIFHADLVRAMRIPLEIDFIRVSSYQKSESTEKVQSILGIKTDVAGRHIILVEDIVDTGHTMDFILHYFNSLKPASITVVTLLSKPAKLLPEYRKSVVVDYAGFEIPPDFVVGYGLDYEGYLRTLPAIYQVETIQGNRVK